MKVDLNEWLIRGLKGGLNLLDHRSKESNYVDPLAMEFLNRAMDRLVDPGKEENESEVRLAFTIYSLASQLPVDCKDRTELIQRLKISLERFCHGEAGVPATGSCI